MKEIHGKLIEKIKRTESICSFRFDFEEKIDFVAGQFLQVIFDEEDKNNRDLNKYLSFSSSPAKHYIEVTKRLSQSQFSEKLRSLNPGDKVLFKAPLGNCVFKEEYEKIAFLIGGIGITPVISMCEYVVDKDLNTDIVIVYSNRTEDDIAFKAELDNWQAQYKNIKVIYTVTDCQPKDATCISGKIDKDLLSCKVCDWQNRICFIFGPPKMVEAIKETAIEAGVSPENIKTESFVGY